MKEGLQVSGRMMKTAKMLCLDICFSGWAGEKTDAPERLSIRAQ